MNMNMVCCPMAAMDSPEVIAAGHEGCHEQNTHSSGMHCDEMSSCHCGIHLALAIHGFRPTTHELEHYPAIFISLPHSAPLAAHWRPPALHTDLI